MFDLKSLLGDQVQKKGLAKSMEASVVCDRFNAWALERFGESLGKQVTAVHFKQGLLTIQINSSVLSQEIKLNEESIKEDVNGILGEQVIKNLAFRS